MPTPGAATGAEASNSSEMEASLSGTNRFPVEELENSIKREYPNVPAVMPIPLLEKIHEALGQEFLDKLSVKLRFGNIDPTALKVL